MSDRDSETLNDAGRRGTEIPVPGESRTRVRDLGIPKTDLDTALQLAGAMEDDGIIRRMATGH